MKIKNKPTKGTLITLIIVIGAFALLNFTGVISIGSGTRVGWSEQKGLNSWSANYFLFTGIRERRLNTNGTTCVLNINVETTDGSIDLKIVDDSQNILYSEENITTLSSQLNIVGSVTATITGNNHRGNFSFNW